jgi:hypothetical protein
MEALYRSYKNATTQCQQLVVRDFCGYDVGMARPPKAKGEARGNVLRVRLTEAERQALDEAAKSKGLETSTWARSELVARARQLLGGKGR